MPKEIYTVDEWREQEGLVKESHKTLEDILRNIKKGGEVISLAQSNIDVE